MQEHEMKNIALAVIMLVILTVEPLKAKGCGDIVKIDWSQYYPCEGGWCLKRKYR